MNPKQAEQIEKRTRKEFPEGIAAYGTDALRFTLARGANPGTDQALAEDWIGGSRNFATKLWNATRFAMMNGATVTGDLPALDSLNAIDKWILSRLSETVAEIYRIHKELGHADLDHSSVLLQYLDANEI
jgi:valyl-tRNA synthetase